MRIQLAILIIMIIPLASQAQEETIVFHNCENYFYPKQDSINTDQTFMPYSAKRWTWTRYNKKTNDLAKTYIALGEGNLPAIIGLCEVESKEVMQSLCYDSPLRKGGYDYIHYDSRDIRGIDVALIYRKEKFELIEEKNIDVAKDLGFDYPTRDVLYVYGKLNNHPLHIFVIHAPSRRHKDRNKGMRRRIFEYIHQLSQELYQEKGEDIIVMGDMNDNPWNKSVKYGFQIRNNQKHNPLFHNLMLKNKGKAGSYVYGRDVLCFDQILVTHNLLPHIKPDSTHIFTPSFLVDYDPKLAVPIPFSTYKAMRYQGGISDHYPVFIKLSF